MSQCLRCSKLCEPTAVFCEECRSLLRNQLRQGSSLYTSQQASLSTSSDVPTLSEHIAVQSDPLERITSPLPTKRVNELPQPSALLAQPDLIEQAVTRLNEAAQLIEREDDQAKNDRKARLYSRASRLSPIVDISADIRRESTPLPNLSGPTENKGNSPSQVVPGSVVPDYWPWLDEDGEDKENDIWANRTDPLISRRIPTSADSASIEEEDIRRALAEGISTIQFPIPFVRRYSSRLRIIFIALAIFALIALIVDGTLLNVAFNHQHRASTTLGETPTLALFPHAASQGSAVQFTLQHFSPTSHVVLTHDIQEAITFNHNESILTDAQGTATFSLVIDTTWGPGFHLIVAEDVTSRSTASANLQIINEGPTPPPHLLITTTPINMGSDYAGVNTIQQFTLANGGGGSITWSANSNQPWLLIAPSQGTFSQKQTISLAVQRFGLKPRDYTGHITISSNVGPPQQIEVDMTIRPLPANAGPVLAIVPALLSFTATDGDQYQPSQSLTMSNPGTSRLNWSLVTIQEAPCNWLSATSMAGSVLPGGSSPLTINVQSQCLLPGAYTGMLQFTTNGTINSSQSVFVSLVVQPHCGLVTSTGFLAFTVVPGQSMLANQSLSLNATASCAGTPLSWGSLPTASWLTLTPGSGQLKGTDSSVVSVSINATNLTPSKSYYGNLSFVTGNTTLTVMVQLTVQATPPPTSPIMGATPLNLNFSNVQGQPSPSSQVVTITNNGGSALKWYPSPQPLLLNWLGTSPSGSTIAPGQSGQVTINVNTAQLTPGNYVGQVMLYGRDIKGNLAPGSPQTVMVNLVVQPPCTMSPPSSSTLSFSAVQSALNPAVQTITFTGTGSCVWPITWNTSVAPAASWLSLLPPGGAVKGTGQSGNIGVNTAIAGLAAGTYSTNVKISAIDANGAAVQGSAQSFMVNLTILPPCMLSHPSPAALSFTVLQGQSSPTNQNVTVKETGTCGRPVSWKASASSAWLKLSTTSGTDGGRGSTFGVNATATGLAPGSYSGTITITATDSSGSTVSGSGQSISVALTVTGFTISGNAVGCSDQACTTSQPLAGASVTLMNGSTTVATTTANASGKYSFSNIPQGSYTINVTDTDANNIHYQGSHTLTLNADALNTNVNAFPV